MLEKLKLRWKRRFCRHGSVFVTFNEVSTYRMESGVMIMERKKPFRVRTFSVNCALCGVVIKATGINDKWTSIKE